MVERSSVRSVSDVRGTVHRQNSDSAPETPIRSGLMTARCLCLILGELATQSALAFGRLKRTIGRNRLSGLRPWELTLIL